MPQARNGKLKLMKRRFIRERQLWLSCIPMIIWVLIFAYYPMYGLMMAFVNFVPGKEIFQSNWVGLFFFRQFITSPDFKVVIRNTLAMSLLGIGFGFPAPIVLALMLNEVRNKKFKKAVQTISYLPHFISWVVVASIIFSLLGSEGLVNEVAQKLQIIDRPVMFLSTGRYFWGLFTVANIWKGVGFSSIIYLSAMAGIDHEMYEAGTVDGLGRFGLMWYITLPGIRTTAVLLFILGIGGLLNAGFEQQLLLGNPQTREYYEVIDTYAYKYGIQLGRYSYGTAVGFMKSIIALCLVFLTNRFAKKIMDVSII